MVRKLYVLCVSLLLLAALGMSVCAAEIPDWDTVNWETYNWKNFHQNPEEVKSMEKWLAEKAAFSKLFDVARTCTSASFYELDTILNARFIAAPEEFLIALVDVDKETQGRILSTLFTQVVPLDHNATIKAIEGIRLSQAENPEAVELLQELIATGEKKLEEQGLNVSIAIPKTGDPVTGAVAALLLSGSGLILLRREKKSHF